MNKNNFLKPTKLIITLELIQYYPSRQFSSNIIRNTQVIQDNYSRI